MADARTLTGEQPHNNPCRTCGTDSRISAGEDVGLLSSWKLIMLLHNKPRVQISTLISKAMTLCAGNCTSEYTSDLSIAPKMPHT